MHTLMWTYSKDANVSLGFDAGWLDQVEFTPNPPLISIQPQSQTALMGATVPLTVTATGFPPLAFQWRKDGVDVPGAIASTLTILNAMRRDSGLYSVLITNRGGMVLSSNASVLIHVPQKLGQPMWQPGGTFGVFSMEADGVPLSSNDPSRFEAQASSNLLDWVTLTNDFTFTNGGLHFIDPQSTNFPSRFYRVLERN